MHLLSCEFCYFSTNLPSHPQVSKLKAQFEQEKVQMVQAHTRETQAAKERASSQLKQLEVEYGGRVAQVSEVGGKSSRSYCNCRILPHLCIMYNNASPSWTHWDWPNYL